MATLRAPERSGDEPTRPPECLVDAVIESFVEPWEVESVEEAELLAEARFSEEMNAYHRDNVHRTHEIVVPIIDAAGFEGEVTTTVSAAYSGLSLVESRALLLNLAPRWRNRDAFEQAMRRGAS